MDIGCFELTVEIIEKSSKLSMVQPEVFPKKQTQVFNSFYLFDIT